MAQAPNAILAISSTDRYTTYSGGNANQPVSDVLLAQYEGLGPYANDFSITAPNALINGYIEKIIISQIQIQYYLPNVIPGRNNTFIFDVETSSGSGVFTLYTVDLPYGFFTPFELAAMLTIFMNNQVYPPGEGRFTVEYSQGNIGALSNIGFTITLDDSGRRFKLPSPPAYFTADLTARILKTYKLFGFTINNVFPEVEQYSWFAPVFLYTPYIDIFSDALTNYQALKDTDSSTIRRKGLIARIYLSGVGSPQTTIAGDFSNATLGCEPFVLTFDLNSPKIVNWTPDTAVNSLDFQVRDCYGDLLFTKVPLSSPGGANEVFNTEFQMTLLCVENDR